MSVVITGATGHLGRLVVESLLQQGVPARDITAAGRDTTKIKDLADRGVRVRAIDYDDPATLEGAFRGAARILLISASATGQRARQHGNAIDAARRAGTGLLTYTSIAHADTSTLRMAEEHRATEAALRASGLEYVLLRHSWYTENYTAQIPAILQRGSLPGSADDGRVSAATRADYAAAAAAVLAGDGHAGRVYELGGDQAFTLTEFTAEISAQAGAARQLPRPAHGGIRAAAHQCRAPRVGRRDHRRRGPRPSPRRPLRRQRPPAPAHRPADHLAARRGGRRPALTGAAPH